MYADILLYCGLRALNEYQSAVYEGEGPDRILVSPEIPDETYKHPSGKVLDFGLADEIVRDYVILAEIGDKVVAYCNVLEAQAVTIIQHVEGNPALGFRSWSCYDSLLCDPDYQGIADQVFKYPVSIDMEVMGTMQEVSAHLTVKDARDRGVIIDENSILVPNQWAGLC